METRPAIWCKFGELLGGDRRVWGGGGGGGGGERVKGRDPKWKRKVLVPCISFIEDVPLRSRVLEYASRNE